jgi:hypothetical protein
LVFRLTKLRRTFYGQIERASFRTAWVDCGPSCIVRKPAAAGGKLTFAQAEVSGEVLATADLQTEPSSEIDLRDPFWAPSAERGTKSAPPCSVFDDDEGATTSRKVREVSESPWQSYSAAARDREYVALLSYLPLNSAWRIPWLVLYSTRIRRQLSTSPGLIGYSLRAQIAAKRFWTLSAWEDAAALQASSPSRRMWQS